MNAITKQWALPIVVIAGWLQACDAPVVSSQEVVLPKYKIEAAFLYNFAKLVDWPTNTYTNATAPLVIGVLGRDPFGHELDDLVKNKQVDGHPVTVRRFKRVEDVRDCEILFISNSERDHIPAILAALRGRSILTVAEIPRFAAEGGMIQLVKQAEAIRFEINTNATAKAHLTVSSKLLALAIALQPKHGEPEK